MTDINAFLYRDTFARGGNGPLKGLTVGVKANIAVAGMPFHAGIEGLKDRIAESDAEVVTRLRQAGAAIVGILNMEEAALGSKTDNPAFGATQNPHRIGYSPGGSSGGSAAAVAAGLCDVALGTDTMGSVRIPAAHCGVYGYKPGHDRISQDGLELVAQQLDTIGPIARSMETLVQVAYCICDLGDRVKYYKGAVLREHGVEVHPDVAAVHRKAMHATQRTQAEVRLSYPLSRVRFAGFIFAARELAQRLEGVDGLSDHLRTLLRYGIERDPAKFREDCEILEKIGREVRAITDEHGFLLLPTVPNPPFAHSDPEPAAQADFTCLANIAGIQAISLPGGWTADGLPIGVQIIGKNGYEAALFALANRIDGALAAYRPPPMEGA